MEATIAYRDAAARTWDVLVVGAGPSGATASRELARSGLSVLLVDQASFPRAKVCGCCLNRCTLAHLSAVALGDLPARCNARPLNHILLAAGGRHVELPLAGSVSLSRTAFDTALIREATLQGTRFLPATRATLDACHSDRREVVLVAEGQQVRASARVVLAADGLGGRLLSRQDVSPRDVRPGSRVGAGVVAEVDGPAYRDGVVYMACGSEGYVGLVRLEDGRLDLAAALDPQAVRGAGSVGTVVSRIIEQSGLPNAPWAERLAWRGTPRLTQRPHRVAAERAFAIGDAAGYVEPFTGEGIAWAMASAVTVTPILSEACRRWQPELMYQWERTYRRLVGRRQGVCRLLAWTLRHERLTRSTIALLSHAPFLASPVLRCVTR